MSMQCFTGKKHKAIEVCGLTYLGIDFVAIFESHVKLNSYEILFVKT